MVRPCSASRRHLHITLPLIALDTLASDAQPAELRRLAQDEATPSPSIFSTVRCCAPNCLRLAQDEHVLLFTMHHIVSDGWSTGVLVRELGACYTAALRNEPLALPPLAVQYADYTPGSATGSPAPNSSVRLNYWRNQLAELAPWICPPTAPVPAQISGRGATLPFALTRRAVRTPERAGSTAKASRPSCCCSPCSRRCSRACPGNQK